MSDANSCFKCKIVLNTANYLLRGESAFTYNACGNFVHNACDVLSVSEIKYVSQKTFLIFVCKSFKFGLKNSPSIKSAHNKRKQKGLGISSLVSV